MRALILLKYGNVWVSGMFGVFVWVRVCGWRCMRRLCVSVRKECVYYVGVGLLWQYEHDEIK